MPNPNDPKLGDKLAPNDPRRRALRGGGKLRGEVLRAEIRRQADEGSAPSDIAKRCRVSRQLVHRVLNATESEKRQRISDDLLAKMVAALRAGHSPAELVDQIPEIATIFKARDEDEDPAATRERVSGSLRQLISAGGRVDSGPARELYEARQAGRLGATPAEESPPPSKPTKPKRRAK